MKTLYRLPSGKETFNARVYCRTWRAFAKPLCKALDAELVAFDPRISLVIRGRNSTVQFDCDVVRRLTAALRP